MKDICIKHTVICIISHLRFDNTMFRVFLNQLVNQLDMYITSINVLLNSSDISFILTTILNTNDKFSNNIYFESKRA